MEGKTTKKLYSISTKDFEEELQILKELNFETLSLMDVYYYIKFGKKILERSVLLTFDDGYKNFMLVYPLLKQYG